MSKASEILKARRRIESEMRQLAYEGEYADEAEFQAAVDEETNNQVDEWEIEAAQDREMFGYPEDTPCIQSADMWGTGEGQYHGVI